MQITVLNTILWASGVIVSDVGCELGDLGSIPRVDQILPMLTFDKLINTIACLREWAQHSLLQIINKETKRHTDNENKYKNTFILLQ